MAITLIRQPLEIVPAHNDIELKASSTNYAQPDFHFYVTVYLPYWSVTLTYKVRPIQIDTLYFNFYEVVNKYIRNYYPFREYGWQNCIEGILEVQYAVDEYYSGAVHTTGIVGAFNAWNASLTTDERAVYLPSNYECNVLKNDIWLNNIENGDLASCLVPVTRDQDAVLYFLQTGAQISTIQIDTYYTDNATGPSVGTSYIANPTYPVSTVIADYYKCINLGLQGLANLASGSVTGTYPVVSHLIKSWKVTITMVDGITTAYSVISFVLDESAPKYPKESLVYLNRKGAFDFLNCYGNHKELLTSDKTYFKGLPQYMQGSHTDGSTIFTTLTPLNSAKKVMTSNYSHSRTLESGWLTDYQLSIMPDLITSPNTFINYGGGLYKRYLNENNQYAYIDYSEKIKSIQIQLSEGVTERRQHE